MSAPMLAYAFLAAGFGLLAFGGETFLRGAIGLSKASGLSPLFVGLIVASVGGALPELSVVLQAATRGASDLAISSVVGENIFNILFVLGTAALIRPIPAPPKIVFRDGGTLLIASLALVLIATAGGTTLRTGIILIGGFFAYLALSFVTDWRRPTPLSLAEGRALARGQTPQPEKSAILLVVGLVCLFLGGRVAVNSAEAVARVNHVSATALGSTLVAVGMALPVLATTLAASARGMTNMLAGQLIGANIFNILFVLGVVALLAPLPVPHEIAQIDVYVAAASAGVVVAMMMPGWRIARGQGAIMVASYVGYVAFLVWRNGLVGQ